MDTLRSFAQRDLAELAASAEADFEFWQQEFRWVLSHPAISAVQSFRGDPAGSRYCGLANQFPLCLDVACGAADELTARVRRLARQLSPLIASGAAICIDLAGVANAPMTVSGLVDALTRNLCADLARVGLRPTGLWLSGCCDDATLAALSALQASAPLGRPGLLLRVSDDLLAGQPRTASPSRWLALTRMCHARANVVPVLQATTRPACALSVSERAGSVLPLSAFEVAAQTAWLTLQIDISQLVTDNRLRLPVLRRLVRAGLRLADNLVEESRWHCCRRREDAIRNRRLALQVVGIGDLADRARIAPGSALAVDQFGRALDILRRLVHRESMLLAGRRGAFPALQAEAIVASLAARFGAGAARRLVAGLSLRHRHLLVASPFAVLPSRPPRYPPADYVNLVACLRGAHSIATYGHARSALLGLNDYRRLLRLTWAQVRKHI